jgi:hypothetical protein
MQYYEVEKRIAWLIARVQKLRGIRKETKKFLMLGKA